MGGGLNFKHPLFRALMERVGDEIGTLSVAHRDRLCRFGFDRFAHLMVIVDTFPCHLYGLRRHRQPIRETAEDGQAHNVTRILRSEGLHRAKYGSAGGYGRVRAVVWRCWRGGSTAHQSIYDIRNAWMADGDAWHGLPAPN